MSEIGPEMALRTGPAADIGHVQRAAHSSLVRHAQHRVPDCQESVARCFALALFRVVVEEVGMGAVIPRIPGVVSAQSRLAHADPCLAVASHKTLEDPVSRTVL